MAGRLARFRVGTQRVTGNISPSQAGYTRQIRSQMVQVEKNYTRLIETLQASTEEAVRKMLQPVFDRSQVLVPVKGGDLKSSGYIETRIKANGLVVGEVGYGRGGVPPYAVFVHENLDAHHASPTQAKFLEQAADEAANGMLDQAGSVYRDTLGM